MRRILFIVGFGILGLAFVFLVQTTVINFLDHKIHQYEIGSDERGEHELKTFFLGGPLFIAVWAWIGNVASRNWRKATAMAVGVLLTALICFGIPGLHGPLAGIYNFAGSSLGVIGWGLLSAALSGVSGGVFERTSARKKHSPGHHVTPAESAGYQDLH